MNDIEIIGWWIGAVCGLFLIACPLILLARIASDVRAIRKHHDRMYNASR